MSPCSTTSVVFKWPAISDGVMRLSAAQLAALFEGLDWRRLYAPRMSDGLTFAEAMRMLAGAGVIRDDPAAADTGWALLTVMVPSASTRFAL